MVDPFPGASTIVEKPHGVWLLVGPTGVGKSVFVKQYVWEGLLNDVPAVYVVTDESPDFVVDSMRAFGFDPDSHVKSGKLIFVDCYSPKAGLTTAAAYRANPEILSEVSIAIEEARRNFGTMRFVVDSVTGLVINTLPTLGQKLMQVITSRIRTSSTGVLTMEAGVPDANFVNFFRFLFDGVFEMKIEETSTGIQRYFRVFSLRGAKHSTAWMPFAVTERGVAFKEATLLTT